LSRSSCTSFMKISHLPKLVALPLYISCVQSVFPFKLFNVRRLPQISHLK
jgi:hypothetical protein